ncbi:hypothetical protein IAD21_03415 [Abditibacteriota bacterium]|nr:hypothetical protein IAD21_03415 [Abditibacteriota bacterium]
MKRGFALIEAVVGIVIVLIIAAIFATIFARPRTPTGRAQCQSNLEQISLGFRQYTQDADNKFPPVQVGESNGWADVIVTYTKSTRIFQCPAAESSMPPLTDYFYNRRLSLAGMGQLKEPSQTILIGDGNDNAPTWASLSQLPSSWLTNEKSPARRHNDGAIYGFADGHAQWLAPISVKSTAPQSGYSTFALR